MQSLFKPEEIAQMQQEMNDQSKARNTFTLNEFLPYSFLFKRSTEKRTPQQEHLRDDFLKRIDIYRPIMITQGAESLELPAMFTQTSIGNQNEIHAPNLEAPTGRSDLENKAAYEYAESIASLVSDAAFIERHKESKKLHAEFMALITQKEDVPDIISNQTMDNIADYDDELHHDDDLYEDDDY